MFNFKKSVFTLILITSFVLFLASFIGDFGFSIFCFNPSDSNGLSSGKRRSLLWLVLFRPLLRRRHSAGYRRSFIWKFGFGGVFAFSLILYLFISFFCFIKLKKPAKPLVDDGFNLEDSKNNYKKIFQSLKGKTILPILLTSFSVLLLAGFYRAFFVLFLKDQLIWSQELILIFVSVSSVLFLPLSLLLIKYLEKTGSEKNVFQGGLIAGSFSIILGLATPLLSFLNVLVIDLTKSAGSLVCNSGRSGLISKNLRAEPEEAGAIDTVFAPLGVAFGAFISGLVISFLGYQSLFIFGGIFVIFVALACSRLFSLKIF